MYTQNSFLTATVEPVTTEAQATDENTEQTTDATATPEVTVSTDGEDSTVTDQDATSDIENAISIDTQALQDVYNSLSDDAKEQIGPSGENISIDENGNIVVVNPESGETTLLSDLGVDMDQLQSIFSIETGTQVPTGPVHKEMTTFSTIMYVGYGVVCVILISLILSQKKRSAAFGNGMSSSGNQQSYWDKNKGRSKEGKIDLYTKVCIGIFMALTFLIGLM